MPSASQPNCPRCGTALERKDLRGRIFECPHCGVKLQVALRHLPLALLLSVFASLLITYLVGLKAYAAILWIPIFLVCLKFVPPFLVSAELQVYRDEPPKKQGVIQRNLALFLAFWLGLTALGMTFGTIYGWGAFFLGSKGDVGEVTDFWSVPLAWINPAFRINPHKSFLAVLGIIAANSYFYALVLTLIFKFVHGIMQRNRVTQLSIGGTRVGDDDDDGL